MPTDKSRRSNLRLTKKIKNCFIFHYDNAGVKRERLNSLLKVQKSCKRLTGHIHEAYCLLKKGVPRQRYS